MATYLIVVKTPDGSDIPHMDPDELAVEVAELLYHEPATVTGRRLDPDAIRYAIAAAVAGTAPDPEDDARLAELVDDLLTATTDAVVAYLEAPPPASDWVALTPDPNTLPPMTTER